jgi:hypothetical protein
MPNREQLSSHDVATPALPMIVSDNHVFLTDKAN